MPLFQLVYVSEVNRDVGFDFDEILASARTACEEQYITGALWYNGHYFIQVLEGSRRAVNDLFIQVSADARHQNVQIVKASPITRRYFSEWNMKFFDTSGKNRADILAVSPTPEFDPYATHADELITMLKDLSQQIDLAA